MIHMVMLNILSLTVLLLCRVTLTGLLSFEDAAVSYRIIFADWSLIENTYRLGPLFFGPGTSLKAVVHPEAMFEVCSACLCTVTPRAEFNPGFHLLQHPGPCTEKRPIWVGLCRSLTTKHNLLLCVIIVRGVSSVAIFFFSQVFFFLCLHWP